MTKNKRGISARIWILIILTLIVVGVIGYFLLIGFSNGGSILGGNSIPQPPALPE